MEFIVNKKNISFEEFKELHPEESSILTEFLEEEIKIEIQDKRLMVSVEGHSAIYIDIVNTLNKHKVFFYKNSFYKDPLAKAIGLKKNKEKPHVLDATAGMLGDSLLIYSYGVKSLTCCERNPVVACMVFNAISNNEVDIDFHFAEAINSNFTKVFDVVYYDPMYQEKNSKAAPKKEMAVFRKLVGPDQDIEQTAKSLFDLAKERLVIKRSVKAKPLLENPSHSIKGKSTAYDVYLKL